MTMSLDGSAFVTVRNTWALKPVQAAVTPVQANATGGNGTADQSHPAQPLSAAGSSANGTADAKPLAANGTSANGTVGQSHPAAPVESQASHQPLSNSMVCGPVTNCLTRIANALDRLCDLIEMKFPAAAPPAAEAAATAQPVVPLPHAAPPQVAPPQVEAVPPIIAEPAFEIFDIDEDVDAASKCGVCHGGCNDNETYAMDCGHYPYCPGCIELLEKNKKDDHFNCPACQAYVKRTLKLNFAN